MLTKPSNPNLSYRSTVSGGFIALTAVIMLSSMAILFSIITLMSAKSYADQVNKKEYRIQAVLNADACLYTAHLLASKDYFIQGEIFLAEFGCTLNITNDNTGSIQVSLVSIFNNVREYRTDNFIIPNQ